MHRGRPCAMMVQPPLTPSVIAVGAPHPPGVVRMGLTDVGMALPSMALPSMHGPTLHDTTLHGPTLHAWPCPP